MKQKCSLKRQAECGLLAQRAGRSRDVSGCVLAISLLFLGAFSLDLTTLSASEPGVSPVDQSLSVDLYYQEAAFEVSNAKATFAPQAIAEAISFKKEPPALGGQARRQFLQLGGNTNDLMALLWDPPSTLYLDLNRNLDLTDDAAGVFKLKGVQGNPAFPHVQVEVGGARYCFDLKLFDRGRGVGGTASLRSFYQGRVELGGKPWQVGVIRSPFDAPEGTGPRDLLVRPWEERAQPFNLSKRLPEYWKFDRDTFFQDGSYQVTGVVASPGSPDKLRLALTRRALALGRLRLEGANIHRLVMEAPGKPTVVLDDPPAMVQVPIANYIHQKVSLKRGVTEATADFARPVEVKGNSEVVFRVGGPLTNSVSVERRGNFLVLNYKLLGVGGIPYQLSGDTRSVAPQFAIHQNGRRLATGKFEFG